MTTYAYPITLNERVFNDLYEHLQKLCEELESNGNIVYDSKAKRPIGSFPNILEVMREARECISSDIDSLTPAITFTLTDYLFIPLENLLKEKCQQYKNQTGRDPFDPVTGEPQLNFASMLEAIRFAIKSATLNSSSSFVDSAPVKLWSPKRSAKE
jgi:hypothetical protein